MEHKIDEENFRIELKGSKKEIKRFARCLVEIVDKNLLGEFKHLKFSKEEEQLNLNAHQRVLLTKNSIIYIPNAGEDEMKRFYFYIMKDKYKRARENFLK